MATKEIVRSAAYGNDLSVQTTNARGQITITRMSPPEFRKATGLRGNAASNAYNEYLRSTGKSGNGHVLQWLNSGDEVHKIRQLSRGGKQITIYPAGTFDRKIKEAKPKRLLSDKMIERILDAKNLTGEARAKQGAMLTALMK